MYTPGSGRIAFCGTRGLPANYGGFETAVDHISRDIISAGYECDVFCRSRSKNGYEMDSERRTLVFVRGSRMRALDTFVSSLQTSMYLLRHRRRYAHVFWFNNANLPGILITWCLRIPFTVNTDGLEWRRAKWSLPFKAYYFLASALVTLISSNLISDSMAIQSYYRRVFRKKTTFIPYGATLDGPVNPVERDEILRNLGLKDGRYFVQITRFEPDNLVLLTAEAFVASGLADSGYELILVGYRPGSGYAELVRNMERFRGIKVLDAIYDKTVLLSVRQSAVCYIHGNSVGGTNPALLEAMASCKRVLAIDVEFSREVLGEDGVYFSPSTLQQRLLEVIDLEGRSRQFAKRLAAKYVWSDVAMRYIAMAGLQPLGSRVQEPDKLTLDYTEI